MPHETRKAKMAVTDFQFDYSYQRAQNPGWIKKTLPVFDPDAVGVLHISDRGPGGLFVVDGQHRVALIRQAGKPWSTQAYDCKIYSGLSIQQEANLFEKLNWKRNVPAMAQFKASLTAGAKWAIDLQKLCAKWGRSIGNGPLSFDCIQKLKTIWFSKDGPEILEQVLKIASPVYPDQRINSAILGGLAWLVRKFNSKLDQKHLAKTLEKEPSQDRIIGEAKMMRKARIDIGVAENLIRRYNTRIGHERALPSIDASETK